MRKASAHEQRVQKVYGLGPGEYRRIYDFQGGKCFICQRATGASRRLSVDHDHKTGKVRGLLCRPCNDVLGHLRDDPEAFERGMNYLNSGGPARFLEIDAVHEESRACEDCKHPKGRHGPNQGCLTYTRGRRCSCRKGVDTVSQ